MGAAYFYHLTRQRLEQVLPMLISRAQGAGWRIALRGVGEHRMDQLDDLLWQGAPTSFLPHGRAGRPYAAEQPVLLTTQKIAENEPHCVMTLDGAEITAEEVNASERVCILFDGTDDDAVQRARDQWRSLTRAGCDAQYWSQADGSWAMKAQHPSA